MNQDPTPEQMMAMGFGGLFCCLVFGAAFIAVLVWMLRQPKNAPAPAVQQQQGYTPPPVPPTVITQPGAEFHLSVVALAFDGYFRGQVEQLINAPAQSADPVGMRVELVHRVARALLGVQPQWRHFGYGEKDLIDLPGAQQSFNAASADFRARSTRPEDGGALVVLTLILCTRGRRLGVDRLDTRQQVHDLLQDRVKVDGTSLLGAELLWSPASGGLTEFAVKERFPEMHALI
ncbi:MAG: DUF1517 domain-containing protein [Archangium sp.]